MTVPPRIPTISDVARAAGVSAMTVSRVINARANVAPATRERVAAAIAALGFSPNPAARTLAGGQRLRLGLLYSNPSAGYLSEFLLGALEGAGAVDALLAVERCDAGDEAAGVARLTRGGVDGVVLPPPLGEVAAVLHALGDLPFVSVAGGTAALSVGIDDRAAAAAIVSHLVALGHRRIGMVAGDPNQSASGARVEGYRDALASGGIAVDPALVGEGRFTYRSGLAAAERLLDLPQPPTAIFAANDDMAAAAIAVAHARGLDVPGDLSVCGFDDTAMATAIWPELTTIRQPVAAMARAGVEMLAEAVRGGGGGGHRLFDHALIRRGSDGPPES